MFARLRITMIAPMAQLAAASAQSTRPQAASTTASAAARDEASSDPRETYLVAQTMRAKMGRMANAWGIRAIVAPAPVAIPLPPLNPINGDQQCPATAATAVAATHQGG